jgi:Adenylyl/Guanylyl and SMODS C-terminal sensor domain/Second Messenger Oligonucleotide or Dinucleotide Synthetase domain
MSQAGDIFGGLLSNLKVVTADSIAERRDEITKTLNKEFRDLDGSTSNRLMVGSYGRWTAIKGISDLDLLYIVPTSLRSQYETPGGPSSVLKRARDAIQRRYPSTTAKVDRLVVVVEFSNFMFEVQPVFENSDGSFSYPDTYSDSWKVTKPREEISALAQADSDSGGVLRHLCKLARAWRNKQGVVMGGLLIDTLAHNFIRDHDEFANAAMESYGVLIRDFLRFLADEDDHDHYGALGSGQHVKVKKRFQRKARKGEELAAAAIEADGQKNAYKKWRAVFGTQVPAVDAVVSLSKASFADSEQFIEDLMPVDIRYELAIDCTVTQDGFRPQSLRSILSGSGLLMPKRSLTFRITSNSVPEPFTVKWKVLNVGDEAERRNSVRGEIIDSSSGRERREHSSFRGRHHVECYITKNGVVVARDEIEVPISSNA